jgi:signal transduction histidine kinase
MPGETLLSTRAKQWRDWALFAVAALLPALAVGWLGLRALQGEEDATRRELSLALQTVAERTTRRAQDEVDTATVRLGKAPLSGSIDAIATTLEDTTPPFAEAVVVSPDGDVLVPAPPSTAIVKASRSDAPRHCADLATALASRVDGPKNEERERFLTECEESRTSTGRWLWPIIALRSSSGAPPDKLASWMEQHASSMGRSERAASLEDAHHAAWLAGSARERVLRALSPTATIHEAVAHTLQSEGPASALRNGPDQTGLVRWRSGTSWGVLRQLTDGKLAGFVTHAPSLEAAVRQGWPPLSADYRASVLLNERDGTSEQGLSHVAAIAPSLGLRIGLADPSLPARQAARGRMILVLVGAGAMAVAFAVAAVLFARMRAANRLSDLRTGFVSTVSHELRTPIASLRMLAELLEQGRVEDDERDEVHAALAREAKRLGDTVDRLLGFSRMAAGRYVVQRQEASIVAAVERSIETFEERHRDLAPIQRRLPASLEGDVDEGQLQLAVDNLLSNAHKYAPTGTPYRVEVRDDGDWVTIEVGDHGPGLARRDRKRVFQPFERGDDRLSSAVQGSGIGLSLVRHVAEAHDGVAEVDAEPGGGACFRIRFPRRVR